MFSRRQILGASIPLSAAMVLGACTTTQDGNVTTHTLNVAKIKAYAQAGLNAAATVTSVLALNPSFTVFVTPIRALADILTNTLEEFTAVSGDAITVSYDDTSIATLVNTLIDDLDKILITIGSVLLTIAKGTFGLGDSAVGKITVARDALATLISVFKILVGGFIATASGGESTMTEAEAFGALNVQ